MRLKGGSLGVFLLGLLLVGASCTKKQPYDELYKENVHSKSVIDTNAEYLYLPTNVEGDRQAPGGRPFWVGEAKLVKFEWGEKELRVVEIDKDERFRDNPTNVKVVLTVPVEHIEYRCRKDQYGECMNAEEAADDVNFASKGSFKPDFRSTQIKEVNLMPIELDNIFDGGCFSQTHTELVGYNLSAEGLNLQIERTYKASAQCVAINELDDLFNMTFKSRYNYSIVKMDRLASPGYKAITYPGSDENTFGFFTTELKRLAEDNRDTEDSVKVFMNRWNPARKEIVYNLSPAFAKPENKVILDSTVEAVKRVNLALSQAKSGLQIRLEMPQGKISGDLRHTELVLIEDPLKVGLLGYGPSVTNPRTGEIVYARVAMYLGVMKQFIWREYNALVQEKRMKLAEASITLGPKLQVAAEKAAVANASSSTSVEDAAKKMDAKFLHNALFHSNNSSIGVGATPERIGKFFNETKRQKDDSFAMMMRYIRNPSDAGFTDDDKASIREKLLNLDEVSALSLTGAYPAELFNFQSVAKTSLDDIVDENSKLWEELTDAERAEVIEKMMPYVWIPTLVHEIGHTLGLRHNFGGSEDAANFYTEEELKNQGIDRKIPYSSVMEYPYSDLSALQGMGKYDVAALRFGYAREVELADGTFAPVTSTLASLQQAGAQIKPYEFCTDDHVDANPNCNRFDEGTNLEEISKFLIRSYEDRYNWANKRNSRRNFSLYGDGGYIGRMDYTMYQFRLFYERYNSIQQRFNVTPAQWESIPFLKDLKQAVNVSASFMINTLLVPDTMCAVAEAAKPNMIVELVNLDDLDDGVMDCFDPGLQINPAYVVVGQAGKSFKSRKASTNPSSYADQIDLRGIWGDKLLAVDYLLSRRLGSSLFDKEIQSFLEHPDIGPVVLETLTNVLLDRVENVIEIEIPQSGQKLPVMWKYSLDETHVIPEPLDRRISRILGLRDQTPFSNKVVELIESLVPHTTLTTQTRAIMDAFSVSTELKNDGRPITDYEVVDVGTQRYFALARNIVAREAIAGIKDHRVLSAVTFEQLVKVFQLLQQPTPDTSALTPEEKAVFDLGADKILDFAQGNLKDEAFYGRLLSVLPKLK